MKKETIQAIRQEVVGCIRCPRLVAYREQVAETKRRAYRNDTYWGKPVPGWGDPDARLLIIGLAPAAHGGNRTGRVFTGDASGDFLFHAMHRAGFANQPTSRHADDGLALRNAYITAVVHCAPPDNKPLPVEMKNCLSYLERELTLLRNVRAVLVLGRIALDGYRAALNAVAGVDLPARLFPFAHGAAYLLGPSLPRLFISYHPSRQNTQTGRLTQTMFGAVFGSIRSYLDQDEHSPISPSSALCSFSSRRD